MNLLKKLSRKECITMNLVAVKTVPQHWARPKEVGRIVGYKDPSKLLKSFREFCEKRPNFFSPHKPFIKNEGMDISYDILCFAFYFENRNLLDAGSRSLNFQKDLIRLKEVYL